MFKILLILFAFLYLTFRLGGYLVRILYGQSNKDIANQSFGKKPKDGNVTINYDPKEKKKEKGFEGGEYIDYEEVD